MTRLGFIVPSSNIGVEPLACRLLAGRRGWSAHFARLRVETVTPDQMSRRQFSSARVMTAARQLADAQVGVIAWAGTSGAWLGIDSDECLAEQLSQTFGVAATTSTLSVLDACAQLGLSRVGLVTPYTGEIVASIKEGLGQRGLLVVHESHLDITDSFACSQVEPAEIERTIRDIPAGEVDGIVVLCTNMIVSRGIASIERRMGVPVVDSAVATVWRACVMAGEWSPLRHAGQLLALDGGSRMGGA